MLTTATHPHPHPARRNLYAGLGAAMLGAAALVATISVVNTAADAVLGAAGAVTQDAGPVGQAALVPLLSGIQLPPAPATCSPASLDDRAGQVAALQQAQAAEQQTIAAAGDSAGQLAGIRDRAQAAVSRVQQIDSGCPGG